MVAWYGEKKTFVHSDADLPPFSNSIAALEYQLSKTALASDPWRKQDMLH